MSCSQERRSRVGVPLLLPPSSSTTSTTSSSSSSRCRSNRYDDDDSYLDTNTMGRLPRGNSSKADLYSNQELMNLLQIHQSISATTTTTTASDSNDDPTPETPSLQDLIVQTVQDISSSSSSSFHQSGSTSTTTTAPKYHTAWSHAELLHRVRHVRAIISDVDGTLLWRHRLPSTTEHAITAAVAAASSSPHALQYFMVATGKTRVGAMTSLGPKVAALLHDGCPGVYVQGLYCVNERGDVIFERKLSRPVLGPVETWVRQLQEQPQAPYNLTLLAYDGNDIYYHPDMRNVPEHLQEVRDKWGEPVPIPLRDPHFASYAPSFHKLLLLGTNAHVMTNVLRPPLEAMVATTALPCVVTQAIPTMLEVLPAGCSKATGVRAVCEYYGLDLATQVLCLGDAENDIAMLQQASLGVAVPNAVPALQQVADIVLWNESGSPNVDNAAGWAMEWFGLGKMLDATPPPPLMEG